MRFKISYSFLILFTSTSWISLNAQNGTVSAGGEINSNFVNISYSIGQTFFTNIDTENGLISEGIQQVYIENLTAVNEINSALNIKAYPNPTSKNIELEIEGDDFKNFKAILLDIQGRSIAKYPIEKSKTTISLENIAKGVYFLNILSPLNKEHTFKIIKE